MQIWKCERPAQMEHAAHTQDESERALNERILKLEGRRIQLEEVPCNEHKRSRHYRCSTVVTLRTL